MKKAIASLTGVAVLSASSLQAAVPAEVTAAITDITDTGAAVFAAVVLVALPFIAWRLVRKIKG